MEDSIEKVLKPRYPESFQISSYFLHAGFQIFNLFFL